MASTVTAIDILPILFLLWMRGLGTDDAVKLWRSHTSEVDNQGDPVIKKNSAAAAITDQTRIGSEKFSIRSQTFASETDWCPCEIVPIQQSNTHDVSTRNRLFHNYDLMIQGSTYMRSCIE